MNRPMPYLAQPGILSLKKLPLELGLVDAIAVLELSRFEWLENMLRRAELREPGTGASPVPTSSLSFTIRIVGVLEFRWGAYADRGNTGKGGVWALEFAALEVREESARCRLLLLRSVIPSDSTVDK